MTSYAVYSALAGALCLALSAGPAAAQADFVPGTGSSASGVARIQARSSGLAVGIGMGVARSRFAGSQGNAEAASVDLGLFDTLAKAPLACGYSFEAIIPPGAVPARVVVSSGGGATEKRTASAGEGGPLQFGSQYGAAAPNASARSAVDGVSLDVPGVVRMVGGTALSAAQLVPGSQRQSSSASALTQLSLAGGLVELDGLRWSAAHRTGSRSEAEAGFSLASMRVGGQILPTGDPEQLAAALAVANAALAPIGLTLTAPEVRRGGRGIEVGALRLSLSATPALLAALNEALLSIQPVRTQLLESAAPLNAGEGCGLATGLGFGYLVLDIATLVLGEQGALDFDLGGAAAGTSATRFANPFDSDLGRILPGVAAPPQPAGTAPHTVPVEVPAPSVLTAPAYGPDKTPPASARTLVAPVALAPAAVSCRSTHDGEGCTAGHGRLAAWIALALIAALAVADRVRSLVT